MATKLKVNYEFVGDSTTPVTRTNSIKHGDKMLDTVINNLENYVTPQMFGAKGDGVTDDSDAIQTCLDKLHNKEAKILDLQGKTYIVNKPLHADSMYKCVIRNGYLKSTNFQFSDDINENYILRTTVVENQLQPESSGGYCFEDNIIEGVTIDCNLQNGLGCLAFDTYMRIIIDNCDFRRYKTYGIKMSDDIYYDGHEMIVKDCFFRANFKNETNVGGIGIHVTKPDNFFSNLVIVGGKHGIEITKGESNFFDTIHIYSVDSYAMRIVNTNFNTYSNMYFDGGAVYIYKPWRNVFSKCYFLGIKPFSLLVLDKGEGSYQEISGLEFNECSYQFFDNSNPVNMIDFPNGYFDLTNSVHNVFDIKGYAGIVDNSHVIEPISENFVNLKPNITFAEGHIDARTHIYAKDGIVYISYFGEEKLHNSNDLILNLPCGYRPSYDYFNIPFVSGANVDKIGFCYLSSNGDLTFGEQNFANEGRVVLNFSFPIV